MSAIGPGDWVECVNADPLPHMANDKQAMAALRQLRHGEAYRVVGPAPYGGLVVAGIRAAYEPNVGWAACRFRPIYRPKSELIETLLRKAHVPAEGELVEAGR